MKSFEELEVWKKSRTHRMEISTMVKSFPAHEKYKLCDQLLRSPRSIGTNISEGYGRFHYQENIQFCRQARGSLFETLNHLICAFDEGHIDEATLKRSRSNHEENLKLLNGYITYLKKAKSINESG